MRPKASDSGIRVRYGSWCVLHATTRVWSRRGWAAARCAALLIHASAAPPGVPDRSAPGTDADARSGLRVRAPPSCQNGRSATTAGGGGTFDHQRTIAPELLKRCGGRLRAWCGAGRQRRPRLAGTMRTGRRRDELVSGERRQVAARGPVGHGPHEELRRRVRKDRVGAVAVTAGASEQATARPSRREHRAHAAWDRCPGRSRSGATFAASSTRMRSVYSSGRPALLRSAATCSTSDRIETTSGASGSPDRATVGPSE